MNTPSSSYTATRDLQLHLHRGGALPVVTTGWRLAVGEVGHVETWADCWWYGGQDVAYEQRFLAFGGPVLFAATALGSAVAGYWRRTEAARRAAPQWRPIGEATVLLTNQRTLLVPAGASMSVWHDDVLTTDVHAHRQWLTLQPENDVPYGLVGPDICYLAVALTPLLNPT
jgi:hypothetical protein